MDTTQTVTLFAALIDSSEESTAHTQTSMRKPLSLTQRAKLSAVFRPLK
jgi:hypothetical protein